MSLDAPHIRAKDKPDLGSFDWADPFLLDSQLQEEERLIAQSARSFAQEALQPRVTRAYAEETSDPAIFREMGEMGFLGCIIDEEWGGLVRFLDSEAE